MKHTHIGLLVTLISGFTALSSLSAYANPQDCNPCAASPTPQPSLPLGIDKLLSPVSQTVDPNLTAETRKLLEHLRSPKRQGILFGHHDSTFYGLDENNQRWNNDGTQNNDRSDVKTATGSHAALLGVDVEAMIQSPFHPAKKSDEDEIRRNILAASRRGQVVTLSWHAHDPVHPDWKYNDYADRQNKSELWETKKETDGPRDRRSRCEAVLQDSKIKENYLKSLENMAVFFKSLKDTQGKPIPILFRPFHEQTGGWFWWGKGHCSEKDFADLWKLTVKTLRDTHQVHQLLYVYSPNQRKNTPAEYYQGYPGDDYVDVLAMDAYHDLDTQEGAIKTGKEIGWMVREARKKGKIAALAETGLESFKNGQWGGGVKGQRNPKWFSQNLGKAFEADPDASDIAYFMVWRNASKGHHYFPAPSEKEEIQDFLEFKAKHKISLLNDWNASKVECLKEE